jgi:hypothetical protein
MKATFAGTFAFKVISMNMTAQASPAGFKGETASDVERFELHAEKLPSMGAFSGPSAACGRNQSAGTLILAC